mmetsp:Transcript_37332/g.120599  ORF Transcript_37332/g.120599 Transcript_37332/m.120599 type:complete len:343 (+) Transcript_37332:843-1871(+)
MPSHIDMRRGRFEACVSCNSAAAARPLVEQVYPEHNLESLVWCARMAGDRAAAVRSGDAVAELARRGLLVSAHSADLNSYERYLAAPALTDVYFRDWDAALHRPPPRAGLHYVRAASLFARGMALAQTGREKEAISALLELQAESRRLTPLEHGRLVLLSAIYVRSLRAAVLAARRTTAGQLDAARAAVVELEAAVRLQDAMGYDEPPSLYASRRPALALAVLEVGEDHAGLPARAAAAAILREELSRLPRSPEALGLCAEARLLCSADADTALLSALRSAASPERVAVAAIVAVFAAVAILAAAIAARGLPLAWRRRRGADPDGQRAGSPPHGPGKWGQLL